MEDFSLGMLVFNKGFVVFHRQQGDSELLACPVLAKSSINAKKDFLKSRNHGEPASEVVAILSLEDLDRHRRSILSLAQERGVGLTLGGE